MKKLVALVLITFLLFSIPAYALDFKDIPNYSDAVIEIIKLNDDELKVLYTMFSLYYAALYKGIDVPDLDSLDYADHKDDADFLVAKAETEKECAKRFGYEFMSKVDYEIAKMSLNGSITMKNYDFLVNSNILKYASDLDGSDLQSSKEPEPTEKPSGRTTGKYKPWYPYGLGQYMPYPDDVFGRPVQNDSLLRLNTESSFMETLLGCDGSDYAMYKSACMEIGFTYEVAEVSIYYFTAKDSVGRSITLSLIGDRLTILAESE